MNEQAIAERFAADGIEMVKVTRVSRRGISSVVYMKRPDDLAAYVERRFKLGDKLLGISSTADGHPMLAGISRNMLGRRIWWGES